MGATCIPVVNELVLLLVYAATCFRPLMRLQRGQNHTRWVYKKSAAQDFSCPVGLVPEH